MLTHPAAFGCDHTVVKSRVCAVLERVLSKELTLQFAQDCGIPVPRSYAVSTTDDLEAIIGLVDFPVVMKPSFRRGQASFKVRYFHSFAELRRAVKENEYGEVLIQEYCPGVGIGVEVLI